MTTITLEQVRAWHPCSYYTDERLAELAAGRASITVDEALDLPIPAEDRVWLLAQPGVLPAVIQYEWVETTVSRAVRTHALACGVTEVEQWAASWLAGVCASRTRTAVRTARRLLWEQALWDAWASAEAAAWAAISNTIEALLWASHAAMPYPIAERERQIADLRAILAAHTATA